MKLKENQALADFLINSLLSDDGFIKMAHKKRELGGLRVLSMLGLGEEKFKKYVMQTVIDQLNIEDPASATEEEPTEAVEPIENSTAEDAVEPIDSEEPAFVHKLLESCPTEFVSLVACFDDVEAAKVCANCVWIGLTGGGFPDCEDFHGKFESSMAACVEECNTEVCSDLEANLLDCAVNAIDCIQTASVM